MKQFLFALLLSPLLLLGQSIELSPAYPTVTQNGEALKLAWFGGLNAPQLNGEDLDGDGIGDMYIFDKAGEIHLALKGDGNGNYDVAPDLTAHFPEDISEWIMLRDFDQDGAPDIFTYAPSIDGITVYRGHRRNDGLLEFSLIDFGDLLPLLYFPFNGNRTPLFVSSIDYPSVADMDYDGDLDILTFSVNGGYMEYYRNQSVERGFGLDTLIYTLESQCWGGFFESGLSTALDLAESQGACFDNLLENGGSRPRHSGSTVTAFDYDGNGRMDIMLGDVSFDRLVLGLNNGSIDNAWISAQDSAWNDLSVIADIPSFPAAYYLDVDQDGARDIVGSPSVTLNGADVDVTWYYRNAGTEASPNFVFTSRKVLVEDMLDLGTAANVTVFDYDADGRPDLVLGNNDEYNPTSNRLDSRLRLLRNVTPANGEIAFELIDEDYLGMSAFINTGWAFAPTFGDLDDDGDLDIDGRIRFYHNIGTATNPVFNEEITEDGNVLQLGSINTNAPGVSTGHPTPWVIQNPEYTLVMTGNRQGHIEAYRFGIDSAYTEDYTLLSKQIDNVSVGGFANPGFADFNGDGKLELVLGSQRGGATFFHTNLNRDATTGLFSAFSPAFDFQVSPNPASDVVNISGWPTGAVMEATLLDVTGQVLRKQSVQRARTRVQWQVEGLSPGVYLVRLEGAGGLASRKVVIKG